MDYEDRRGLFLIVFVALLAFAACDTINYFSQHETANGFISAKWTESSTSCDENSNCTTSITYLFQIKDNGKVYKTLWGASEWDRLQVGQWVQFTAYGYTSYLFGARINVQSATDFQTTSYLTGDIQ